MVGVIGTPVEHSLSPRIHQAAFEALGLDWVSVGFAVDRERLADAIGGVKALSIRGLSVTMPHKEEVVALVDRLDASASRLHAVNCISVEGGESVGLNTDGQGFVDALEQGIGFDPSGKRCAVIGAGGAARAVIAGLTDAGAASVGILVRDPKRAGAALAVAGGRGELVGAHDVLEADLVVQATPVGMAGTSTEDSAALIAGSSLQRGQVAVDLVYHPRETSWLRDAQAAGATTLGGLGMLVHQAALQIEHWCGVHAPLDAMWASVASSDDCV